MLQIQKNVELKPFNTFAVSALASNFITLDSVTAARRAIAQINRFSQRLVLGGGSNVLFVGNYRGLIIYPQLFGIECLSEDEHSAVVAVGGSENWHNWVLYANQQGWFGLENLALIPGTVGASPVQNIGAYGVEVKQFVHQVEAIDLTSGKLKQYTNAECEFDYRDSFFKRAGQGRHLVTRVIFKLNKQPQLNLSYQPLAEYFNGKSHVSAEQVIKRVCEIRAERLPDPSILPNAGSFFKNPLVTTVKFEALKTEFPQIIGYPHQDNYKLAAGWLIDQAGFKGMREGEVGVHRHQALVLVNYAETDGDKIRQLATQIQQAILAKYGVALEPEVRIEGG